MDIENFLNQNYIKQEVTYDNIYASQMSDLPQVEVQKQAKVKKSFNWKQKVNRLLHLGYHKKQIVSKCKSNIRIACEEQKVQNYLDKVDGLVGSIIIDCKSLNKQFPYSKCSKKLKSYHKFAINCNCDNYQITKTRSSEENGTIDGLLSGTTDKVIINKKKVCKQSGLPVITSLKQIKKSQIDQIVDELKSNKEITEKQANIIKASKNPLSSLKKLFANKVGQYIIKSESDDKYVDQANNFELKDNSLYADVIVELKDINLNDVRQKNIIDNQLQIDNNDEYLIDTLQQNNQTIEGFDFKVVNKDEIQTLKQNNQILNEFAINSLKDISLQNDNEIVKESLNIDENDVIDVRIDPYQMSKQLDIQKSIKQIDLQPMIQKKEYSEELSVDELNNIINIDNPDKEIIMYEVQVEQNPNMEIQNNEYEEMNINDIQQNKKELDIKNQFRFDF